MKKNIPNILSYVLIVFFLSAHVSVPAYAAPAVSKKTYIPPFPEDVQRKHIDWASIDWEHTVVLPEDTQEFYTKVRQLEAQGKHNEVKNFISKKIKLKETLALEFYDIPRDIKQAVQEYAQKL